jgi:Synaptobrevin
MHYHNIHHNEIRQDEKVALLMAQVQDIRKVMGRNLHMILERGEKFEGLLTKSEVLTKDAQIFKKRTHTAKCMMQRKYYSWYAMGIGLVALFIYVVLVFSCGLRLEYCRASSRHSNSGEAASNTDSSGGDGGGDGAD